MNQICLKIIIKLHKNLFKKVLFLLFQLICLILNLFIVCSVSELFYFNIKVALDKCIFFFRYTMTIRHVQIMGSPLRKIGMAKYILFEVIGHTIRFTIYEYKTT
jgi:hypothetical protein